MRRTSALCAAALLSLNAVACGVAGKDPAANSTTNTDASSASVTENYTRADHDKDNDGVDGPDSDNNSSISEFGHRASAPERRTIVTAVRRYYETAAAAEGAKACSMMYPSIARSLPEDEASSLPGHSTRGATCATVLNDVFKRFHTEIALKRAKLEIGQVRIDKLQGVAILKFGSWPEREFHLEREGHIWRIEALLDTPLV